MKKIFIVLAVVTVGVITSSAQDGSVKPGKGSFSLEAGFSPFSVTGENIQLHGGQIRAIYSVTDKVGIRLGLGFGVEMVSNDNGQSGDDWRKTTGNFSNISFTPGIIYNFSGTDRLTPYIGGELIFATSSANDVEESRDSKTVTRNLSEDGLFNTFGLGLFSGFNYYLARNLYAGAELGLSLKSYSLKNTVIEATNNGQTQTMEPKDKASLTSLGTVCTPAIRLGWVF
ncbi:MAG: porin family protein [Tannerella sp.]|jgi:outer membrane protein W|nr:porin family protein [Tannerella sp.]